MANTSTQDTYRTSRAGRARLLLCNSKLSMHTHSHMMRYTYVTNTQVHSTNMCGKPILADNGQFAFEQRFGYDCQRMIVYENTVPHSRRIR
jgi:hypothetical protein